jgi:hypothetical protein
MANPLERDIKAQLKQNLSKKEIYIRLGTERNRDEVLHMLNNLPTEALSKKMLPLRIVLLILLSLLTIKQFLFVYIVEQSSLDLMLGLIGPLIHIYIIRELLRNHRLGYQILPILSLLALFRPENNITPDTYMYIGMALLSGFLYLFLFPQTKKIEQI